MGVWLKLLREAHLEKFFRFDSYHSLFHSLAMKDVLQIHSHCFSCPEFQHQTLVRVIANGSNGFRILSNKYQIATYSIYMISLAPMR